MATQDDTVGKGKDSEAKHYDKFMENVQKQVADDLNILNRVQSLEGKKVLDLGCGTGNYTYRLAERVGPTGRVIGIDPDKKRIKIANEKWKKDNLTFLEGDDQTFPEDQYDLIFSRYVIHWIQDKQTTFNNVYKNLKSSGGQFAFIAVHGPHPIGEEMSALMGPEVHHAINKRWHYISADEYRQLAINVGFTVTLIEEDNDDYMFPNVDIFLSSWQGITDGKFDASKADQTELSTFKLKYGGKPIETKLSVIRIILVKH